MRYLENGGEKARPWVPCIRWRGASLRSLQSAWVLNLSL